MNLSPAQSSFHHQSLNIFLAKKEDWPSVKHGLPKDSGMLVRKAWHNGELIYVTHMEHPFY